MAAGESDAGFSCRDWDEAISGEWSRASVLLDAILNDIGIGRLRKSVIDELITTDTVLRPAIAGVKITTLSVAGLLGEAIKRIHSNSSVTSLFEFRGGRTS